MADAKQFIESCKTEYNWWKNATTSQRNQGKKYWSEFSANYQSWCSEFIGWNLKHIGAIPNKTMPKTPTGSKAYYTFYTQHKDLATIHNLDQKYKPQPGDIILQIGSNKNDLIHTEMVAKVAGNEYWSYSGGSSVSYKKHTLSDKSRYWFITLNWDKVIVPKTIKDIAQEVIDGKWGSGTARKTKLEKAGYNYNEVQAKVNDLLYTKIAKEVIAGKWGNAADRKKKLTKAGWNYDKVQAKVNSLIL